MAEDKVQLCEVHGRWGRPASFCASNSCAMKGITVKKTNENSFRDDVTSFADSSCAYSGDENDKSILPFIPGFSIDTVSMFSIVSPSSSKK